MRMHCGRLGLARVVPCLRVLGHRHPRPRPRPRPVGWDFEPVRGFLVLRVT